MKVSLHLLVITLQKAHQAERNVRPQKQWKIIKIFQTPPTVLNLSTTVPQNDVDIWNSHPEIPTTIQGNLHIRTYTDQLPRDTIQTSQTQDDSPNTIQETPNSQFRMFLLVWMPGMDSLNSVNRSPSPPLFSPKPASSLAHVPTYDSPQSQPFPLPLSLTQAKPLPITIAQNCSAPPFQ